MLTCLASVVPAMSEYVNYLMIAPQSPVLQIGTNFTAMCWLKNTTEVTAEDLIWKLAKNIIPKEQYTTINSSALNVTFTVTSDTPLWLFCSKKDSPHVKLNPIQYLHGISLRKGYPPQKPKNLSCIARQDKMYISPIMRCEWEPRQQQRGDFKTTYTLNVMTSSDSYNNTTQESSAEIKMKIFPNFLTMEIWVEAGNLLGKEESEHLLMDANSFIKTNPPSDINIISEKSFPSSFLLNWTRPIDKTHLNLIYEIRFAPKGSHTWTPVDPEDTRLDIESFRLQNLRPNTVYVTQVRCKNEKGGYWSDWSVNSTKRTPASKPSSKPDLWQIIIESKSTEKQQVQLLSKEPEFANGKIKGFEINIQTQKDKLKSRSAEWESIPITDPDADSNSRHITLLKQIDLPDKLPVIVKVTAFNSEGKSPEATMIIPEKTKVLISVQELKVYPNQDKLHVEWTPPNSTAVSEYVVEWARGGQIDWQREKKDVRKTIIRGNIEKFVRYNVSVYPLYSGRIGTPARVETYLEQDAPDGGPSVRLRGKPGYKEVHLVWDELPLDKQRGFITNYTICYSDGTIKKEIPVLSNTYSYTLKSLTPNTRYDAWIRASTIKGSANGFNHSFTTLKYATGEIEGIVVGASLGFLFVVVLTMLLCICKKDVIKKSFWPQIPNPGESTIGNWSPDYPLKAETPSENCLSGISVLDVDICDGKSVFEEDKACLPLKKDKYLSEEHSSGIGGSSCMSSPRQSVSDSDEGGDIADTTASTVQYSSVVASSGYKGQTPSLQPQQAVFSRSESTQPLLESEENPDMLSLEGSRQSQRFPRQLSFTHSEGNPDNPNHLEMEEQKGLDFCPVGENSEQMMLADGHSEEWLAGTPISSYMPQLGGYRPQ